MRIDAFLQQSPMFAVSRAARRFTAQAAEILAADDLNLMEGLVLAAIFFEEPQPIKPSALAETFETTRGNISHCVSSLEARGLVQRKIDPEDARAFRLGLKPQGRRCALRVIGAFDRLQRRYEEEIGKSKLSEALAVLRRLEGLPMER